MKRVLYAIPVVALFATVAYSQAPGGQMQGQKIGLATSLQRGYNGFKTNFTAAAEKMPEADYSFKPGSTPEARTYAQVIAHIAQAQFGQCSGLKGVPNPMAGKQLEQELKTKAEVTKALADSFAMCDELFANLTDASATEMVKASTLLSVISVAELLLVTKQIVARTFMTLEFYLIAGLIYFLINYAIERAAKAAERRVALPS